jgi:hemolysin D
MSEASSGLPVLSRRAEPRDPTLPAILEFQWPSTAIVNAPIPRSARGIIWMITSLIFVVIALMGLIPIDQVVTARGIVVSQSPTVLVQPLETAIVRSINVREGQLVRAGELLGRLDPTFADADFDALNAQVTGLTAEVTRLQAEAADKPFIYGGTDPKWQLQVAIYGHRKAQF